MIFLCFITSVFGTILLVGCMFIFSFIMFVVRFFITPSFWLKVRWCISFVYSFYFLCLYGWWFIRGFLLCLILGIVGLFKWGLVDEVILTLLFTVITCEAFCSTLLDMKCHNFGKDVVVDIDETLVILILKCLLNGYWLLNMLCNYWMIE